MLNASPLDDTLDAVAFLEDAIFQAVEVEVGVKDAWFSVSALNVV